MHNFGVALGTEHDVDVLSDTLSNHMVVSSTLEGVQFFIQHPMLIVIVVVSNQGTVHYLKRDKGFDYGKVVVPFSSIIGRK